VGKHVGGADFRVHAAGDRSNRQASDWLLAGEAGSIREDALNAVEKAANQLRLVDLPPFPGVAVKALQLVSKPESRLRDLHDLISMDQAFATEILRLANSPLYGIRSEITSTLQAVMLLGYERVKGLLLTLAVKTYIGQSLEAPILKACWSHSLASATIAEELAMTTAIDKDVAYTAALIHDIGRLALAMILPEGYNKLRQQGPLDPGSILQAERDLFGMDHCQAGGLLVTTWNLPLTFIEVASYHHEPRKSESLDLVGLVSLACQIADALGFSVVSISGKYEDIVRELPDDMRRVIPGRAAKFLRRIADKMNGIESVLELKSIRVHPDSPVTV